MKIMNLIGNRKNMHGYFILKMTCYQLLSVMLDIQKESKIYQDLGWKIV